MTRRHSPLAPRVLSLTRTPALLRGLVLGLLLIPAACAGPEPVVEENPLQHTMEAGATPWAHENFDDADDKFTFAVFTDLNGGERDRIFEVAVEQLNLLGGEFIITVGDLIDGGIEDRAELGRQWDWFDARASRTRAPIFYVGGNHDLTNQVMREVWAERYGSRYYHFVYKDVLFLVLDTEDNSAERMREIYEARAEYIIAADSGDPTAGDMPYMHMPERVTGGIGAEQSAYMVQALADNPDVRWTFVFMHKPAWMQEGESDFAEIETALASRPYTVFNGHLHTYSLTERNGRDYIMLGTTGGSQNARSDMAFDHLTLVTMPGNGDAGGPTIGHLKMEGILDKTGHVPLGGDTLCFQASKCGG